MDKYILIENSKHFTRYWDATTNEEWAKSSLAILTEWVSAHWPYYAPDKPSDERPGEGVTQGDIDSCASEAAKSVLQAQFDKQNIAINRYEKKLKAYEAELEEYNEALRIVNEQDLSFHDFINRRTGQIIKSEPVAWVALMRRSHYEYCDVDKERLAVSTLAKID